MNYYPYDSRNLIYRSKFGALAEGDTLRLKLLLPDNAKVKQAFLNLTNDATGKTKHIVMTPAELFEDYRFYECEITPDEGIYWYDFKYISDHGEFFVTKDKHSLGIVSKMGGRWQITVYKKDYQTPDWLDGGIIYQIFPDRFYNSGKLKKNVPNDRYICEDWYATPEYRQEDSLKFLGNDYYGGDLEGIRRKLPYLKSLGVNCIYLNPIFEAHSNHRYNTADYLKIDPLLGDERALEKLVKSAESYGIHIILDGVFSHTGDDSVYFNKYSRYDSVGAYNSENSPYSSWYSFKGSRDNYKAWWGISTLPETNENDPSFTNFITGENGVIKYWLKKGVKGFRLDVADELPDEFLDKIREAIKTEDPQNFLLGEVWEDATNKISYDKRRRFLRGTQLDSVMNYPFANAIIKYLKGGNSRELIDTVLDILENYPPQAVKLLMNHIGTHDTPRILTILGSDRGYQSDRKWQSEFSLTPEEYKKGVALLKVAAVLQYTLPGIPSLYYGDEAGMQGYGDPFCRAGYPWGREDTELLKFYKKLGKIRRKSNVFASGEFIPVYANFGEIVYIRKSANSEVLVAVSRWHEATKVEIPERFKNAKVIFGNKPSGTTLDLNPYGYTVLELTEENK